MTFSPVRVRIGKGHPGVLYQQSGESGCVPSSLPSRAIPEYDYPPKCTDAGPHGAKAPSHRCTLQQEQEVDRVEGAARVYQSPLAFCTVYVTSPKSRRKSLTSLQVDMHRQTTMRKGPSGRCPVSQSKSSLEGVGRGAHFQSICEGRPPRVIRNFCSVGVLARRGWSS